MRLPLTLLLIALGGALGAMARFGLGGLVQGNRMGFPYGTLVVNLLGCLVMGFLVYWVRMGLAGAEMRFFLGTGILGGFTTFSSFSAETLNLLLDHNPLTMLLYVAASLFGCLLMVTLGFVTARVLWG